MFLEIQLWNAIQEVAEVGAFHSGNVITEAGREMQPNAKCAHQRSMSIPPVIASAVPGVASRMIHEIG